MAKRTKKFKLKVQGRLCDEEKGLVEKYALPILKKLLSTRMINTLTITVKIENLEKGVHGKAFNWTNGSQVNRTYTIGMQRSRGRKAFIETLAHELCHVAQFATNRLQARTWVSDRQLHARWDGDEMGPKYAIPYMERPWEVEAFAFGAKFVKKFKD